MWLTLKFECSSIDWLIDLIDWLIWVFVVSPLKAGYFLFVCLFVWSFSSHLRIFQSCFVCLVFFRPTREFFNLVLFVWGFRPTEIFSLILRRHHCWWRAANLTYAQHSWPLSSEGSLACHTYWLKIGSSILNPMWVLKIGSNSSYQRDCAVKSRMEMERIYNGPHRKKKFIRRREHRRTNFAGRSSVFFTHHPRCAADYPLLMHIRGAITRLFFLAHLNWKNRVSFFVVSSCNLCNIFCW